jgi:RNA polymerase sigma-32 factor
LIDETSIQEIQHAANKETDNRRQARHEALIVLNPRERRIYEVRRLTDDPVILAELASEYDLSSERIRQIEANALDKVRRRTRIRLTELQQVATERFGQPNAYDEQQRCGPARFMPHIVLPRVRSR